MKQFLSLALALALSLSLAVPALAADPYEAEEAAWELYGLGLFQGTGTDDDGFPLFDLDQAPTRAQGVTMLVRLIGKDAEAQAGEWTTPFLDVPEWAEPYVGYAYANGLTTGRSETVFDPDTVISATEYLTFVLRALGYSSGEDFAWDSAWTLSDQLGFTDGSYNAETNGDFDRGDVAVISRDALGAKPKGSSDTLKETLSHLGVLNEDGQRCQYGVEMLTCAPNKMYFAFAPAKGSPEAYKEFQVNSVTVNGVKAGITQYGTAKDIKAFNQAEKTDLAKDVFALAILDYDQQAAEKAATDAVTVGGLEYPVLTYKFNCTGTLKDGTQVKELFAVSYYIEGYGGPYA